MAEARATGRAAGTRVPVVVLGAAGYVGGEVLRLVALHPGLELRVAVSQSQAGQPLGEVFPHLRGVWEGHRFGTDAQVEAALEERRPLAVFAALPHGETATRLDALLARAERAGCTIHLVDLSADFRIADPAAYERVYGRPHGAPARLPEFLCALPDITRGVPEGPVAHPGCFTTATTLACAPLHALGLAEPRYAVTAITGSTGSGREPGPGTHHPERHANLRAYSPLAHRHEIEMRRLLADLAAPEPEMLFAPHSGPFARGIHATVHARLHEETTADALAKRFAAFYEATPFVDIGTSPPSLKEVVGTNRCRLGVAVRGRDAVVLSVIDNLTKGAAGGGMQWMNRMLGFEETAGLRLPGLGWH